jgi:hypothetical protein
LAAVLLSAVLACGARSATAATFCVNKVGPQCDQLFTANQISQAFQTAFTNGQATFDRIEIGPGVYAQDPLNANSALEIIGSGMGETVITHSAPLGSTGILLLANYSFPQQKISDLTVRATKSVDDAIDVRVLQVGGGVVERVRVEATEGSGVGLGVNGYGVTMRDIEVKVPRDAHGVAGGGVLEDSTIEGGSGLSWNGGTIRRVRVRALERDGIYFGGSLSLENSVIEVSGPDAVALGTSPVTTEQLIVSHVTAIGAGSPGSVALRAIKEANMFGPTSASIEVRNSTFTGFEKAVERKGFEGGGGPPCASNCRVAQNVSLAWSHLVGQINDQGGPGSITLGQGMIRQGGAGFLKPSSGDYRLRYDSPLVDAGEPVGLAGSAFYLNESPLTLSGGPRVLAGRAGATTSRRDIGAYEYGRGAPAVALAGVPKRVYLYRPVRFMAKGEDPDGDPLRYRFGFGKGEGRRAEAATAQADYAFVGLGRKRVTVTALDPTGLAAEASAQVEVVARRGRCANRRVGGRGRDRFLGSPAGDDLRGRGGNDVLRGGRGADCLDGGPGKDRLVGGPGADRIKGGPGKDRVLAGPGNDRIDVRGGGRDTVDCGPGRRDRVTADRRDRLRNCELVRRR